MSPEVICLGEGLIDRIFHRYASGQSDAACWVDYPGGAPANVATGLAKLGTTAGFVGAIGQDEQGQRLMAVLSSAGVDCSHIQSHPIAPTRVVLVQRDEQGERHFVGFSQSPREGYADTLLQPEQLPFETLVITPYLVMGTLGLAAPETRRCMERALQWSLDHHRIVVVDVNWRPAFWPNPQLAPEQIMGFISQADIVKCSQEEADWLFHTTDAREILHCLDRPKCVLVTAGEDGCGYATEAVTGKMPAFRVDCEDATGAGDAFLAGFIHQLSHNGIESLQDADRLQHMIRYASAAGALTTLRPGAMAAQPLAAEVDAFLYLQSSPEPES